MQQDDMFHVEQSEPANTAYGVAPKTSVVLRRHDTHEMHDNSLRAFREDGVKLGKRCGQILAIMRQHRLPLTARDVLEKYCRDYGIEGRDMNLVRPRISELVKDGWLREAGRVRDKATSKTVSTFEPVTREGI